MASRPFPDDAWVATQLDRLRRGAWLLCGDAWEAEDLAQETMVQAYAKWHQFDGRAQESTWLYAIMLRLHQRRVRGLGRAATRIRRWWHDHGAKREVADPAAMVAQQSWRESLWAKVAELDASQAQAIWLRFGQELSYEEVASAMQCPVGTAKSRVHYALAELKQRMSEATEALAPVALKIVESKS